MMTPDARLIANTVTSGARPVPTLVVRPAVIPVHLGIAKFGNFIFCPSHSPYSRSEAGKRDLGERAREINSIKVAAHSTNGTRLTTYDFKTLLALFKIFHEQPEKGESIEFSLYGLATCRRLPWGGKTRSAVSESLYRLLTNPVQGLFGTDASPAPILSLLDIPERSQGPSGNRAPARFRFHDAILAEMRAGRKKPIAYDVVMQIRGEISLLAYLYLDLVLHDKDSYERRAQGLLNDLLITGDYPHASWRKRMLQRIADELNGLSLSSGVLDLHVERAKGSTREWKLIATKSPFMSRSTVSTVQLPNRPRSLIPSEELVLQDIFTFLEESGEDDTHSRNFYKKALRELGPDLVSATLSNARYARAQGIVRGELRQYLTGAIQSLRRERERQLNACAV